MYIYQHKHWPVFLWDNKRLLPLLAEIRFLQGNLLGKMQSIGFQLCQEATFYVLTEDTIKTSEIEGEFLDVNEVRSSLAKHLRLDLGFKPQHNKNVDGIVRLLIDATTHFHQPLTKERLCMWHKELFSVPSVIHNITIGKWRTKASGVMQVVSGAYGREKIHFEAPSYKHLNKFMMQFLRWINSTSEIDLVMQSAIAHFWFVTIHPFDDGNGRIARAIADMLLARSENSNQRFYSMSSQIQKERNDYYGILEHCQKSNLDITMWIEWYLHCLKRAIISSEEVLDNVIFKANFWHKYAGELFNERQRNVINRLLDGFIGKLTSSKWAKMTKCSQDTALRDINDLVARKILLKDNSLGRSTNYFLKKI